jgi:hypothetical protein
VITGKQEIAVRCSYLFGYTSSILAILFSPADAAADCNLELAKARTIARTLSVSVEAQSKTIIGEPVRIAWRNGSTERPKIPVYFVVTTPPDVRFSGTGFVALTAGARGLHGVRYGGEGARAFVPLHRAIEPAKGGSITVLPYRPGGEILGWAVATTGSCGEHVYGKGEKTVDVMPGPPEIVVQDRFADTKSLKRIRSLAGTHDLLVYDGRYEVYEVATGARILDRPGTDPDFSPTGRFVTARQLDSGKLEIIDLVTHKKIVANAASESITWVRNDSYVILEGQFYSIFFVRNIIVDNTKDLQNGVPSCQRCRPSNVQLVLDLDNGFVAEKGGMAAVTDLVDFTETLFEHRNDPADLDFAGRKHIRADSPDDAARKYIRQVYGVDVVFVPKWDQNDAPWDLGEPKHRRVDHIDVTDKAAIASASELRGHPMTGRGAVLIPDVFPPSAGAKHSQAFARLASAGVQTSTPAPIEAAASKESVMAMLERMPINQMPSEAQQVFSKIKNLQSDTQGRYPDYERSGGGDDAYHWSGKTADHWLLEYRFRSGRFEDQQEWVSVYLFSTGLAPLLTLDDREGPDENVVTPKIQVSRISERLVAVASLYKSRVAIVDVEAQKSVAELDLVDGALLAEMRLTQYGGHLVQLNSDGRFFVYRIADGKRMLIGAYVDDEVVVATDNGLYDATYEGAQAVQVRFPGYSGLFRFNQFEAVLRRPGLAAAVLGGQSVAPAPAAVPAPPVAELRLAASPVNGRRTGKVVASAERELSAVRIYGDGRLVKELAAKGRRMEVPVDVADPGGGRWITAVAVDSQGVVSQPSAVRLPGSPSPRGLLRAVLVGVDRYDDPALPRLAYARSDAQRFAGALKASEGEAVRSVRTTPLLDADATPARVLDAIRSAAQATAPEDTLVIFYAGHGIDGRALGQSDAGLVLATAKTQMAELKATSLSWAALSEAVSDVRGTVVIVLDACHAGAAATDAFATNDDAVTQLITRTGSPMVVLAGSKGRQLSHENRQAGGGLFTAAIAERIAEGRTAHGHSSLIDLGELYTAVKTRVVKQTNGGQTPWLVRNSLVGEMALF